MKISIATIVLAQGNEGCENPKDLKIQGSKELQIASLLRAKEVRIYDRGNTKIIVTFKVSRRHPNADEALIYTMKHVEIATSVNGKAIFEIEDNSNTIFYLINASIKQLSSHIEGVTSYHSYELIGSKIES